MRTTRRSLIVASAALIAAPRLCLAQDRSALGAAEVALASAERSRDPTAILRARLGLAAELRAPSLGRTPADWRRAKQLLASLTTPQITQQAPKAAGLARLFWCEMELDVADMATGPRLQRVRAEIDQALTLLGSGSSTALDLAIAGLTAAILARDLNDANRWLALGLASLEVPLPAVAAQHRGAVRGLRLEDTATFMALSAQLAALDDKPGLALGFVELASAASPNAAIPFAPSMVKNLDAMVQKADAAARGVDALVHLAVAPSGATLVVSRAERGGIVRSLHPVDSLDGGALDQAMVERLMWGATYREATGRGVLGGWMGAYEAVDNNSGTSTGPTFRTALPRLQKVIWANYGAAIAASLRQRRVPANGRIGMVMASGLGRFPIAMASDGAPGRTTFGDAYTVSEAPSARWLTGPFAAARKPTAPRVVGLFNPTGNLPGAEAERAMLATLPSGSPQVIAPGTTATQFLDAVSKARADYLYIASHGAFGYNRSAGIALGKGNVMSVADVLGWRGALPVRLVILCACESALNAWEPTAQPSSLPSALLARGAQGVVATLWKVSDDSTALMMNEMMRLHLAEGVSPPAALASARRWLANATGTTLATRVIELIETQSGDAPALEAMAARVSQLDPDGRPYSHPYYWACFGYYGA